MGPGDFYDNEVLIDLQTLNVDAASFTQLERQAVAELGGGQAAAPRPDSETVATRVGELILDIVARRGKMHNPATGSGGMLIGTVREVEPRSAHFHDLQPGDHIATLVSLSLTPLRLDRIRRVYLDTDQVDVDGQAILFESGIYARLPAPDDIPEKLALAVLDVAGAPAQTAKLVGPGDTVVILGAGGKSGLLCTYEARRRAGPDGLVIGVTGSEASFRRFEGFIAACDRVGAPTSTSTSTPAPTRAHAHTIAPAPVVAVRADATHPLEVQTAVRRLTGGRPACDLADVTINCVNVPGTEMAAIMATRRGGTVYFFSMATSFTAAALGAEGIGHDVTMMIGNGYTEGHAELALNLLREAPVLRRLFEDVFVGSLERGKAE